MDMLEAPLAGSCVLQPQQLVKGYCQGVAKLPY